MFFDSKISLYWGKLQIINLSHKNIKTFLRFTDVYYKLFG